MSLRLRRIIYLTFIILFIIVTPLVIFYTAGYRYNWQKSKIEHTGVLALNVKPTDSHLYLNNTLLAKERPVRFTNLLSNYYLIRAEKDNYFPWQKNLEIRSGQSTLAYDIVLFKKSLPRLLFSGKIKTFAWSAKEKKIVYLDEKGVWLKKTDKEAKLIFNYQPPLSTADFQLSWSPNEQFLLLKELSNQNNRYIVIDTSNPQEDININEITSINFADLVWSPTGNHLLYGLNGEELYRINLNRQKAEKIAKGIKNFAWQNGNLYLIQDKNNNSYILKYNSLNLLNRFNEIVVLPQGRYQLMSGKDNYLIAIEPSQNNLYLIDLQNDEQPLLLLKGNQGIWGQGEKNNYLAYYNASEWWIFDPKTKKSQMVGRYSNDLKKVLPVPNIPYYLFILNNSLYLTELDDRDQRNTDKLFDGQEMSKVWLDAKGENIYFLDKIGQQRGLFQLEIQ